MNIYMTFQQSKRSASEQIEQVITGTSLKIMTPWMRYFGFRGFDIALIEWVSFINAKLTAQTINMNGLVTKYIGQLLIPKYLSLHFKFV